MISALIDQKCGAFRDVAFMSFYFVAKENQIKAQHFPSLFVFMQFIMDFHFHSLPLLYCHQQFLDFILKPLSDDSKYQLTIKVFAVSHLV